MFEPAANGRQPEDAMAALDPCPLPPAAWHHLTDTERRALEAVLRRTPVARQLAPRAVAGMTAGERLADAVTSRLGSWPFIVVQSLLLLAWIGLNTIAWRQRWDPYPFILLNLALSFQAAFSAPIIMMSQNRQSAKDRRRAEADYAVNLRAELDVSAVHARLDDLSGRQWAALLELQREQLELLSRIETLTGEVHRATTPPRGTPGATDGHAAGAAPAGPPVQTGLRSASRDAMEPSDGPAHSGGDQSADG